MRANMNLAVAQLGAIGIKDDRKSVVDRIVALIHESKHRGASLTVLPELALTTFFPRHWNEDISKMDQYYETSMPNSDVQPIFDAAAKLKMSLYLGYAELTPDQHRYNTSILINSDGKIVGKYRKIHLPGHADHRPAAVYQHLEKRYFEVGNLGWGVFDLDGVKIGMGICNDRRWPETYRMLSLQSAEIALFGFNTPAAHADEYEPPHLQMTDHLLSLQAGAYQNCMWVAAAAKAGTEDGYPLIGGSAIVAPSGEVVARSFTEEDEVITACIDLEMNRHFSSAIFDFEAHRRPELYELIVQRRGRGDPLPIPKDKW